MSAARRQPRAPDPLAARESFVLPLIFLTVAFAGGFRAALSGSGMRFLSPPLVSLVLAMLVMGVMVRARLLAPHHLMSANRDGLANLSGAIVLATLFAASAQVFNLVTPETGLLNFLFNLFFFLLLWNTLTAGPDAPRLLRSLLVVFGSAFVMKYILLASLYQPGSGFVKRLFTAVLEGVTLGTLEYEPMAPLVGYVAFFTIVGYMIGLMLLPRPGRVHDADDSLMRSETSVERRHLHEQF